MPKDPFQLPRTFTESLALVSPEHLIIRDQNGVHRAFLSATLVDYINRLYKRKTIEAKSYRLPTLKPASIVNLLPTDPFSGPVVGGGKHTMETIVPETSDLIAFSKSTSVISKDPVESLNLVWTGRMGPRLTQAKQTLAIQERRAAEERDAENKSDAKSAEDDEGLLGKKILQIKQRGQEFSARYVSTSYIVRGTESSQATEFAKFTWRTEEGQLGFFLFIPAISIVCKGITRYLGPKANP